jgi:hypothetical protein
VWGTWPSVAVEVETVAVEVFHRELAQAPGLLLERRGDAGATGAELGVRGVDVGREDPVDNGLEGANTAPKEDHALIAGDRSDAFVGLKPANLETERVTVMLLRALDVFDRNLRRRMAEFRSQLLVIRSRHGRILCPLHGVSFHPHKQLRLVWGTRLVWGCPAM